MKFHVRLHWVDAVDRGRWGGGTVEVFLIKNYMETTWVSCRLGFYLTSLNFFQSFMNLCTNNKGILKLVKFSVISGHSYKLI